MIKEADKIQVDVCHISFWKNETNTENLETPETGILVDPRLTASKDGNFTAQTEPLKANQQGPSNAKVFRNLWKKWKQLAQKILTKPT